MTVTSLPLDSLYKFLFVGGLVLLISSMYFYQDNINMHARHHYVLDSLDIIHKEDSISTKFYMDLIPRMHSYNDPKLSDYAKEKLKDLNNKINSFSDSAKSNIIRAKHLTALLKYEDNKSNNERYMWLGSMAMGLILMSYGGWYWREIQKVNDKILLKQYDILQLEYLEKCKKINVQ